MPAAANKIHPFIYPADKAVDLKTVFYAPDLIARAIIKQVQAGF
jgi:hypothetical protein